MAAPQGLAKEPTQKNPTVVPGFLIVIDHSSTETPGKVDTNASDGDGSQVNHEHGKPNREGSQH